ncbi:hypothetical protein ST37_08325 [Vibrio sp. qd031]|uniref:hypothetical protein n=1 Tax=Vibrio sp. qd031 TaxID=1603038 RepID=UPI000A1066F6|nr:hypothetical protein [Vibrio sp. qd031]ORT50714.1 hypothetical protein ST37_08325 [Vibrio sp. qd031]
MNLDNALADFPYEHIPQLPWDLSKLSWREYELTRQSLVDELGDSHTSGQFIFKMLTNWRVSRDPDYLDILSIYCLKNKVPIPEVAQLHMALAGEMRLKRVIGHSIGSKKTIKTLAVKRLANILLLYMTEVLGHTLRFSSEKTAAWIHEKYPLFDMKASSIEKEHSKWRADNYSLVEKHKAESSNIDWDNGEGLEYRTNFSRIIERINASPELIGERR